MEREVVLKSAPSQYHRSTQRLIMSEVESSPSRIEGTPERAPGAPRKRARRSAAILATSRLATAEVLNTYMTEAQETTAELEADDECNREMEPQSPEEEAVTVETRQRRTIKRLEDDVNSLKRARKEDQITIANLRKAVADSAKAKQDLPPPPPPPRPAKPVHDMANLSATLTEHLVMERFNHLNTLQRLSETEIRLKKLHRRLYPVCCSCQEASGQVKLHEGNDKAKSDHVVCLACLQGITRASLNHNTAKGEYISCPLCAEKITSLPHMSVVGLADGDCDAWLVKPDAVISPLYASLDPSVKKEIMNTVLDGLSIPQFANGTNYVQLVSLALQSAVGDYEEDHLIENGGGSNDVVDD
jgi:hypothetical protein